MKQLALKITTFFIASVFLWTGLGTAVADFCCDGCLNQYVAESTPCPAENSCCGKDIVGHADEENGVAHPSDCDCKVEWRASLLDSFHHTPTVNKPYEWTTILYSGIQALTLKTETVGTVSRRLIKAPPENAYKSRDYLSFIQTFII